MRWRTGRLFIGYLCLCKERFVRSHVVRCAHLLLPPLSAATTHLLTKHRDRLERQQKILPYYCVLDALLNANDLVLFGVIVRHVGSLLSADFVGSLSLS